MTPTVQPRLLLVDDDAEQSRDLAAYLAGRFTVQMIAGGKEALAAIAAIRPDVVLLDIDLGCEPDGFAVLETLRGQDDAPPVIMLTGAHRDNINAVVRAIKGGAYHYVAKPPNPTELVNLLEKAIADDDLRRRLADLREELADLRGDIVVADPVSERLMQDIARVARVDGSVLITGESGTGKELVARRIHALSRRSAGPFQDVNCPAVTETLIAAELFGHERGSFTGASRNRLGKVGRADGGTLFLDEIGSCCDAFQAKLLRFLEERSYDRVGGDDKVVVDVRVVSATRIDLQQAIADGEFREDLFYRLAGFQLHIPPLRERPGDIMPQATAFLHRAAANQAKIIGGFSPGARDLLQGLRLARQQPRAAQHHRARGDLLRRRPGPGRGSAGGPRPARGHRRGLQGRQDAPGRGLQAALRAGPAQGRRRGHPPGRRAQRPAHPDVPEVHEGLGPGGGRRLIAT